MKTLFIAGFALFCLLLTGCGSQTVIVMDDYKDVKISGKSLAVVQLFEKPAIFNSDDVNDDLGAGVPDEVYMNFFKDKFTTWLSERECFPAVQYTDKVPDSILFQRTLDIVDKEQMKILLPEDGQRLKDDSVNADFVLFIDQLQIARNMGSAGSFAIPVGTTGFVGGSLSGLYHQVHFAIWDNTNGKIVSYGRVDEESKFPFGMTKGNWESVIGSVAFKILKNSPFDYYKRRKVATDKTE